MATIEVPVIKDRPSLGAIRAQLGLKPVSSDPPSEMASRCMDQAWVLLELVLAHLMYAYRQTCPSDAAAALVAEETVHQWVALPAKNRNGKSFGDLADELVAEAVDHARWP